MELHTKDILVLKEEEEDEKKKEKKKKENPENIHVRCEIILNLKSDVQMDFSVTICKTIYEGNNTTKTWQYLTFENLYILGNYIYIVIEF